MCDYKIHNSYHKKELVDIIKQYQLDIDIYQTRADICRDLLFHINDNELSYLFNPNPVKKISVKQREEINIYSKAIISFCKNGCNIKKSDFKQFQDVVHTGNYIAQFGDITSVRRALKMLKEKCDINITPEISPDIRFKLDKKEQLKKLSVGSLEIKRGHFTVVFD